MGITAGIVLLVSCLVWFTSFDFTKLLPVMMVVLLVWFLVTFIGRMIFGSFGMNSVYRRAIFIKYEDKNASF